MASQSDIHLPIIKITLDTTKNKLYPNQIMDTPIQCNVHRHTVYFYRDYFDMLRAVGMYDMKRGSYLEIVPMHHHSSSAFLAIEFFL